MRLIEPSVEIISPMDRYMILPLLEMIGRTCYKSGSMITDSSASKFVKMLTDRGHHAMLEHYSVSVRFICEKSSANVQAAIDRAKLAGVKETSEHMKRLKIALAAARAQEGRNK